MPHRHWRWNCLLKYLRRRRPDSEQTCGSKQKHCPAYQSKRIFDTFVVFVGRSCIHDFWRTKSSQLRVRACNGRSVFYSVGHIFCPNATVGECRRIDGYGKPQKRITMSFWRRLMFTSNDSLNPDETSTAKNPRCFAAETAKPIRWQTHLVLLATALVSWTTFTFGIALSMRNMFSGPPPDNWGMVFVGFSMLAGFGGIGYFATSRSRRSQATQSEIQIFALLLLLFANAIPAIQIVIAILGRGY